VDRPTGRIFSGLVGSWSNHRWIHSVRRGAGRTQLCWSADRTLPNGSVIPAGGDQQFQQLVQKGLLVLYPPAPARTTHTLSIHFLWNGVERNGSEECDRSLVAVAIAGADC